MRIAAAPVDIAGPAGVEGGMSRRSRRSSTRDALRRPSSFEAGSPSSYRSARFLEPLDYPAERFSDGVPRARRPVRYNSISTGLNDSRPVPRSLFRGSPVSSLYPVRATFRTRSVSPGLDVRSVIRGKELPARALDCAKRVIRKEVLFALGRTGRGARSPRRRRRESSTKC